VDPLIGSALVTGGFAILAILIQRAKSVQSFEHSQVAEAVGRIEYKVDSLTDDVVEHLSDHKRWMEK
jgi:hypothetical protein